MQTTRAVHVLHGLNGGVLYKDKCSICTTLIKWCPPVKTTRVVYVLHGLNGGVLYKDKCSICTTLIKWCRPVHTTRAVYVLHGLNGAVIYKRQEQYMYYMDQKVSYCTNDKNCICTPWIKWCRPVQTTRAVYVLHGLNVAVIYKRQEQYMYYMD